MNSNRIIMVNSYLTFMLGNEKFAVPASTAISILEMCPITELPKMPNYLKGIINLRGKILPIIDLKLKMGMPETARTKNTCIVVVDIFVNGESVLFGAIVDAVMAVVEFSNSDIANLPSLGSKYRSEFISGVINIDESFIIILDLDSIVTLDEIIEIKENVDGAEVESAD